MAANAHRGVCRAEGADHPRCTTELKSEASQDSITRGRDGVQVPVEHNIQLPCTVDPHSASALLTLHGLLFVKVIPANATAPRSLPKVPTMPSSAQQVAQPGQPLSSSQAPYKPGEGNEASKEAHGDLASMEA